MTLFFLTLLFCAPILASNPTKLEETFTKQEKEGLTIKILLRENIEGALIDVEGGYKVFNLQNNKLLSSSFWGKRNYLQANEHGLKWGEGYLGVHQIKIVPKNKEESLLIDGIQYKGSIIVYSSNTSIQIVNEIDVEDVVRIVLYAAFSQQTTYSKEIYEAVAIAARTNLYQSIFSSQSPYWNIHAEEIQYVNQAFVFNNPAIDSAVQETKHLLLTYKDKPFATSWTEHSAGQTASYQTIFRKRGKGPEGVFVGYAKKMREESHWRAIFSVEELAKIVKLKTISSIDLFQDHRSKKVYGIRFSDGNAITEWTIFQLRKKAGFDKILSNDFSVHISKNMIQFDGYGKGYGVGICLFTADQMAKIGDSTLQILSYFFPEAHLVRFSSLSRAFFKEDLEHEGDTKI